MDWFSYFGQVAQNLGKQAALIRQFRPNNVTVGLYHETILRSFLRKHLPDPYSVGHGFIVNADGCTSRQCDVIIYSSKSGGFPFFIEDDLIIIGQEAVRAVIEVKTTLTRECLKKGLCNLLSIKKIDQIDGPNDRRRIYRYLLAFNPGSDLPKEPETLRKHIEKFNKEHPYSFDRLCVLGKYNLAIEDGQVRGYDTKENSFAYFFAALHEDIGGIDRPTFYIGNYTKPERFTQLFKN